MVYPNLSMTSNDQKVDEKSRSRILSIDQFRGFTVLMMFAVNFLHGRKSVSALVQHNENWVSLADWIMPAFLLLVGMAFRLTWPKRVQMLGKRQAALRVVRRSLALIGVSLVAYGVGATFGSWKDWNAESSGEFVAALLKARLWEVLAIIGASQLLVLPVIGKSTRFRLGVAGVFMLVHLVVSELFNVRFVMAQSNLLDAYWGAAKVRAWDGGFFGILSWSAIALIGTVAMDGMRRLSSRRMVKVAVLSGLVAMVVGWGLSSLSTFYDVPEDQVPGPSKVALHPVLPTSFEQGLSWGNAPFTPIPPPERRQINYWMMSKRLVSVPFVFFTIGCSLVLLGCFVLTCDCYHKELSIFRILGANALAAYLIHYVLLQSLEPLFPKDAPLWFTLSGLVIFIAILLVIMRGLERQKLYLRL